TFCEQSLSDLGSSTGTRPTRHARSPSAVVRLSRFSAHLQTRELQVELTVRMKEVAMDVALASSIDLVVPDLRLRRGQPGMDVLRRGSADRRAEVAELDELVASLKVACHEPDGQ